MEHTYTGADGGTQTGPSGGATDTARATAGEAGEQARHVAGTASEGVKDVAQTAREQASHVGTQVKEQGRDVVDQTKSQLRDQAQNQTQQIAGKLREIGDEIRALADGRPDQATNLRGYADQAASKLSDVARRVESRGFDGLLDDVKSFARNRPGAFLLGAVVSGFGVGRLVRNASSDGDRSSGTTEQPVVTPGFATPQTTGLTPPAPPPRVEGTGVASGEFATTEIPTGLA